MCVYACALPKQWRHSAYHHSHFPNNGATQRIITHTSQTDSGATQRITTHTSQTMAPLSVSSLTLPKQWRHTAYHHSHFQNSGATRRITTHTSKTVAPHGVSPLLQLLYIKNGRFQSGTKDFVVRQRHFCLQLVT